MPPPLTAVTSKEPCSIPVLRDLFPLSSSACWARRTGRSLLLGEQHPFRRGFSPSARLGTGREKVLQGPACRGGGGPCRACCGLYLPSLPPVGRRSQPLAGARLGTAAQGGGCLSHTVQSTDPDTHFPGTPAVQKSIRPPCRPWQGASFSCSRRVCKRRKLKACLSG